MPTFTYTQGFIGRPSNIFHYMDALFTEVTNASGSGTQTTFTLGNFTVTATGSNLTTGDLDGRTVLTGGTLDSVEIFLRTGYSLTLSDLGLDVGTLFNLASSTDPQALERAMMQLDWTVTGNSTAEIVQRGDLTSDNTRVHFAGDDVFDLEFGNDRVWSGAGNDTLFGRRGDDQLNGGADNDVVRGGLGHDNLLGAKGRDTLFGGKGEDVIYGGGQRDRLHGKGGDDTLFGGVGNDTLRGGNDEDVLQGDAGDDDHYGGDGADTFIFGLGSGADTIHDWEDGIDHIVIENVPSYSISEHSSGDAVILWNGGSVRLIGVDMSTLGADDITA